MKIETWTSVSFGEVSIATVDDKLCCVEFGPAYFIQMRYNRVPGMHWDKPGSFPSWIGPKVIMALERGKVYDEPIYMIGTDFQKAVWAAVQSIPYGQTVSYSWIANAIGKPKAVRAVGRAVGANPLAVIVPCHRVVGQRDPDAYHWDRKIKRKLLDKEYLATHPMEIVLS